MLSSALVSVFLCQQDYAKKTKPIFTKFGEKGRMGGGKNHYILTIIRITLR